MKEQLKTFIIEYCDTADQHIRFTGRWRGYDEEHALDRFYGAEDADGWKVISIRRDRKRR